ncbi:MAG: T9SS type A sorting domain-containing protein, partial [Ignavibacteriaceae bacterium]|nr:T9SS type A sorting domain-containing protein [Ignavibacteriaceae bacterium]
TISVDLINNSANTIGITEFYNVNEDFVVKNPVPFTLPAFGNVSLNIKFKPSEDGYFKDYLHIRSDTETTRIAQVMFLAGRTDTIFSTVTEDEIIYNYVLKQNYPNPFNPSTKIRYSLPLASNVTIRIYNSIGENIITLVDNYQPAGNHTVDWNAAHYASGIYFYSLEAIPSDGDQIYNSVKKMILLK